MTVPARLSKMVKFHLATGVLFSLALLAFIVASSYRSSVVDISSRAAAMSANADSMAEDTAQFRMRQAEVGRALPKGFASSSPREMMLLYAEKLKGSVRGASVAVDEFSEANSTLTLPVIVEFDTASYDEGTREIRKIWSSAMPYFEFRNIDIRRLDGSWSSARYKIEGVITMPSVKITAAAPEKTL